MWLKIYLTSIIKSGPVLNSRSLLKLNYLHLASLLSIPTRLLTNERRKDYILDPFFCLDDMLTNIQVPNRHVSLDWNSLSSARTRLVFVVSFVVASNFAAHKYLIFTHFLKRGTVMKDKKLQLGYAIIFFSLLQINYDTRSLSLKGELLRKIENLVILLNTFFSFLQSYT